MQGFLQRWNAGLPSNGGPAGGVAPGWASGVAPGQAGGVAPGIGARLCLLGELCCQGLLYGEPVAGLAARMLSQLAPQLDAAVPALLAPLTSLLPVKGNTGKARRQDASVLMALREQALQRGGRNAGGWLQSDAALLPRWYSRCCCSSSLLLVLPPSPAHGLAGLACCYRRRCRGRCVHLMPLVAACWPAARRYAAQGHGGCCCQMRCRLFALPAAIAARSAPTRGSPSAAPGAHILAAWRRREPPRAHLHFPLQLLWNPGGLAKLAGRWVGEREGRFCKGHEGISHD